MLKLFVIILISDLSSFWVVELSSLFCWTLGFSFIIRGVFIIISFFVNTIQVLKVLIHSFI
jgi:hypothetical protein